MSFGTLVNYSVSSNTYLGIWIFKKIKPTQFETLGKIFIYIQVITAVTACVLVRIHLAERQLELPEIRFVSKAEEILSRIKVGRLPHP